VIAWFIKIELKYSLYSFFYYFWGQHSCWTVASIIGNDFFVFYKLPLPSSFLLLPVPYRCSGVPVCIHTEWPCDVAVYKASCWVEQFAYVDSLTAMHLPHNILLQLWKHLAVLFCEQLAAIWHFWRLGAVFRLMRGTQWRTQQIFMGGGLVQGHMVVNCTGWLKKMRTHILFDKNPFFNECLFCCRTW